MYSQYKINVLVFMPKHPEMKVVTCIFQNSKINPRHFADFCTNFPGISRFL